VTIPPVAGLAGGVPIGQLEGLGPEAAPGAGEGPGGGSAGEGASLERAGAGEQAGQATPVGAAEGATQAGQAGGGEGGEGGGFGGALTEAITSLERTQNNATTASQQLATGTVKDPESAVVTVEDATLAMQLAAQIRNKATDAIQTIFQTQA
jgi:flagellar hook-basal body complex protein FliE